MTPVSPRSGITCKPPVWREAKPRTERERQRFRARYRGMALGVDRLADTDLAVYGPTVPVPK